MKMPGFDYYLLRFTLDDMSFIIPVFMPYLNNNGRDFEIPPALRPVSDMNQWLWNTRLFVEIVNRAYAVGLHKKILGLMQ